jgi:hypothetical protein
MFHLSGLPASPTAGALTAWTVTIDLTGPPDQTFTMPADGDGSYDPASGTWPNAGLFDLFGWSMRFSDTPTQEVGPLLCQTISSAGPSSGPTRGFAGTIWDPLQYPGELGIGMSGSGWYRIDGGSTPGCYLQNYGELYLRLYSNVSCPPAPGTDFCFGDTSHGVACPCGNASPAGFHEGCGNTPDAFGSSIVAVSGWLRAEGRSSLSNDTALLRASGMPPNSSALFFQGTQRQNGGAGVVFGDGLRCAGGIVTRLATKAVNGAGNAIFPDVGDPTLSVKGQVTAPSVRAYQTWFRVAANYCSPSTFNLTNGWELQWGL